MEGTSAGKAGLSLLDREEHSFKLRCAKWFPKHGQARPRQGQKEQSRNSNQQSASFSDSLSDRGKIYLHSQRKVVRISPVTLSHPIDKRNATLAEFGKVILMRTAPALAKRYLIPSFPEKEGAVSMVLAPHMEDGGRRRDPSENKMGSTLQTFGADYKKGKLILDQTHHHAPS